MTRSVSRKPKYVLIIYLIENEDENVHRSALNTLRGGLLERDRQQQIINKIKIATDPLVKWIKQIKPGRFRQRPWHHPLTWQENGYF